MRIILSVFGAVATLSFAYMGVWFSANVEPERFTLGTAASWLGAGLIVGSPFIALAIFASQRTFFGRLVRVVCGLALILPGWLFGSIAFEHFRRLVNGGSFLLGSFFIGCAGLLAVLLAVVYVLLVEAKDDGSAEA